MLVSIDTGPPILKSILLEIAVGCSKLGTCEPNSYMDYKLVIDAETMDNNLLIEVEDLSHSDNPSALVLDLVRRNPIMK